MLFLYLVPEIKLSFNKKQTLHKFTAVSRILCDALFSEFANIAYDKFSSTYLNVSPLCR